MDLAGATVGDLRRVGRGELRRRLEKLVNEDVIGVAGAQRVYQAAFGGRLVAVKVRRPSRVLAFLRKVF